jgi:hypothetical protein
VPGLPAPLRVTMPPAPWHARLAARHVAALTVATVAIAAGLLFLMGRSPICQCGSVKLWHGVVLSSENSQHLSDWYTFTHVVHGFGFYALLWLAGLRWPFGLRLFVATVAEASWEILENTDAVIERYREATISLDYYGDSIVNSVADIVAMQAGFVLAAWVRVRSVIALAVLMEVGLALAIRDNLTLNVLMLVYPIDAVRVWQAGG